MSRLRRRIVDEPFEDVPQGGPDLAREQALTHEDLKFIWLVADSVMSQDRRARWMEAWLTGALAYVTEPVLEKRAPVRAVVHDEEGDWHLLCETVAPDEARRMHLHHAIDDDPSIAKVLDLRSGQRAGRDAPGAPWRRASSA